MYDTQQLQTKLEQYKRHIQRDTLLLRACRALQILGRKLSAKTFSLSVSDLICVFDCVL